MNEKQIHNLKTYINWLPAIGAVSSLISFFYFFFNSKCRIKFKYNIVLFNAFLRIHYGTHSRKNSN
ncbi:hypothetical protein CAI16_18985 [Virgibacillus dokdonensis]|uniref:Uncharacterized protein n=1 Tax=Virgibacillus dokdonensis TaxID=302167 RepID=A0A3E0WI61_9BACI|nr:hypothetical protein CAI16_18985 [Virgibacillus dokdonensis]